MTRSQFRAILCCRTPHPDEAIAFAEAQGWRLVVAGPAALLYGAPPRDPVAGTLADLLEGRAYARRVIQTLEARAWLYDSVKWAMSTTTGKE